MQGSGSEGCSQQFLSCDNSSINSGSFMADEKFDSQKIINGRCPAGSYCPEGSQFPIHCPFGTYIANTSKSFPGRYICDCLSCGAGNFCSVGSAAPAPCPLGHFCPEHVKTSRVLCTRNSTCGNFTTVQRCPAGTYQNRLGQKALQSCQTCGLNYSLDNWTGYFCPEAGSYMQTVCPPGHFCIPGSPIAFACPPGTFRSMPGGLQNLSCYKCPEGRYCPNGSVLPISCPPGNFCSDSSAYPTVCPGGCFCPPNSSSPISCPSGTYCVNGSEFPLVCPAGSFCEPRSSFPALCPLGTYANINTTVNRSSIEISCQNCPKGYFGADARRLRCEKCFRGFLCYGAIDYRIFGTTRGDPVDLALDGGEICPNGYFCPAGSFAPTPCPVGTFNSHVGSYNISNCTMCPANYFNNQTGQDTCHPCGGTSYSSDDRTFCQCKGRNRVFQASDSACRCLPGYVIFDSNGKPTNEGYNDGILDCELRSLDRCDPGDVRGQDGSCVQSCDDSACSLPPCYCKAGTQQDYCNGTCPSFQISQAQTIQVKLFTVE